jgi:DtxR family Mn-dependent transcriptional regulator
MTPRELECLRAIERLTRAGWPAKLASIAAELGVRPPTALELMERLRSRGLVLKGPTGYRLSDQGASFALQLSRAHRLLEVIFEKAGLPAEKACQYSSRMDAQLPDEALDALCRLLNHPRRCPHGNPIPGEEGHAQASGFG